MRGLLVVNPRATTTSTRVTDVLVHAFSDELELEVVVTTHRGHARVLGERALDEHLDVIVTLGGDGVIHEVVNGLLRDGPSPTVPALATVPGGSGNVFARALGLPADPVEATGELLDAVRQGRTRTVGLGRADDRWFIANAGLGLDAEIIEAMDAQRRAGHTATPLRYLTTTLTQLFRRTDRRHPRLRAERPGHVPVEGVHVAIVQNQSPWTYFGSWPLDPSPHASFDTGLDLFAVRDLSLPVALLAARRILAHSSAGSSKRAFLVWHDQGEFTITAARPTPLQLDGESLGPVDAVRFVAVPDALRVYH